MTAAHNDMGLCVGATVEFELAGYAGELGRYRFFVRGRDISRTLADRMGTSCLSDGTLPLEPYMDGPGQKFIRQVAKRLLGFENALHARQRAGMPALSKSAQLALANANTSVHVPFIGVV